jgi:rSAM/selenodomain-associated transferase 1
MAMQNPPHPARPAVTVLTKWPDGGPVKTRLARVVGTRLAAELQLAFLKDVLAHLAPLAREHIDLILSLERLAGDPADFGAGPEYQIELQGGGDLGARMARSFRRRLIREGRPYAVLMGSDLPTLPCAPVRQALHALRQVPMVLGPTGDGGYYLVGLTRPVPALFRGIPWSTAKVQKATLQAAQTAGVPLKLVQAWDDIDTPADLARLRQQLSAHPGAAPHTARILLDSRLDSESDSSLSLL